MNPSQLAPVKDRAYLSALTTWPSWPLKLSAEPEVLGEITGGKTNRSWLIKADVGNQHALLVLRLFATNSEALGICRQREFAIHSAVAEINLAPNIVYWDHQLGFSIITAVTGDTWQNSDFNDPEKTSQLNRAITQYQQLQLSSLVKFNYLEYLEAYAVSAAPLLPEQSQKDWQDFRNRLSVWQNSDWQPAITHHDLNPSNIITCGDSLKIIDWEYAGLGHPQFDRLGISASLNACSDQLILRELRYWLERLWYIQVTELRKESS
ncbi:phosphotransferase [Halioxenophilus aromaticivorans]|uniref:Aminoglycoside phosphotransferase domain-containing protein n=1 Tax=Halioxenophilus aromaticivorans TaxID=1306992 RepID=A0AAV3UAJ5_9ALTE